MGSRKKCAASKHVSLGPGGQGVREADGHRLRRLIPKVEKVENGSTCRHANVGQVFKCWTTRWSRSAAAQPQRRNNWNNQKHQVEVYKQCSFQSCCLVVLDAVVIFKLFWSNVTISFQRSPLLTHLTKQFAFTSQSSAFSPTSSSNHVTSQQSKTTEKQSHDVTLCYAFITTLKKKTVKNQFPFVYIVAHITIYIYRYILYIMFTYFCTNQFPNAKLQSTEVKVCTAGGRGSFSTISGSRSCIAESVSDLNDPNG